MGKSLLLMELGRRLAAGTDQYLAGLFDIPGTSDPMLRAVQDLYARWLQGVDLPHRPIVLSDIADALDGRLRDLSSQLGEPRPSGRSGTADAEVVVDHPPALRGQPSLAARVTRSYWRAVDWLLRSTWANVHSDMDHRGPPQMGGGDLELTRRRPPRSAPGRRLGDHGGQ
jgi:hypothetical protein